MGNIDTLIQIACYGIIGACFGRVSFLLKRAEQRNAKLLTQMVALAHAYTAARALNLALMRPDPSAYEVATALHEATETDSAWQELVDP